jgi:hypothetical protein
MNPTTKSGTSTRLHKRYSTHVSDLSITYEGYSEDIPLRPPDLSVRGMFINAANHLPEGTVLKVHFRLTRTRYEINARAEVRYCLPGVGIGVEFVDISPEAQRAIEEELRDI